MSVEQSLNENLSAKLHCMGMTLEDLAGKIGIPIATLRLLEGSEEERKLLSSETKEAVYMGLSRITFQKEKL